MSLKPQVSKISNNYEKIISTPYEKVILILREAINFISMIPKKDDKIIKNLEWAIKMITSYSIYNNDSYGPTFGGGHDLYISNFCNENNLSNAQGRDYKSTHRLSLNLEANFIVESYEVYQVIYE